ncbi:zinc finger protein with KRAB and SCAN domains 7-like [Sceloporus undulatus]|uniref:zinc finger protein with KRAB and SCAN domains 7-like n=1 Tax=Sceloporus undulatus TaxID=8520 RepID=UPI001C4BBB75|nr:zinc finger protein with KRAB and SCAN domains 7-like [Sceloporus undulatus]
MKEENLLLREKATHVLKPGSMTEQAGCGTSRGHKWETPKGVQEQWETQWQASLKALWPIDSGGGNQVTLENTSWEDTKAFLASFEQVAKACRWPKEEWAARLLPALSGEAEQAFQSLETGDKEDYGKVKAAILRTDGLRMEMQRQHFRQFCCQEVEDPRRIHNQLQELCHRWLKPERRSKEQILELLILEQFLASLPTDLQNWIRAGGPDTCSQAVALVEDFMMSQQEAERKKWQAQMKDECLAFLDAEEEPSDSAEGQIYERAQKSDGMEIKLTGSRIKCPNDYNSTFLAEEQPVVQTELREGAPVRSLACLCSWAEPSRRKWKERKRKRRWKGSCKEKGFPGLPSSQPSKGWGSCKPGSPPPPLFASEAANGQTLAHTSIFIPPVLDLKRPAKVMKEQKLPRPKLEERPESTGRISNSIQGEYGRKQPGWGRSQEGQGEPSKEMQQHWETQWQEFLKTLQPIRTRWATPVMPEMAPWEDAKAFLVSFEQVAKACRWPQKEWVARLLPALCGEAEEAFQTLETGDQEDYEKVKAAILRGDALRMELQRQHFRQFCCPEVEDPQRIYNQLQELCHQWLKPERRSKEQILELLILEQFLASLPTDLQNWIRAGGPDTCCQAMALMEDFLTVQRDAEREKWQGQLKEECLVSAGAEEETSDAMKGEIFKETQQNGDGELNALGNGIKCSAASLPLKGLEMVQTGVQNMSDTLGPMNLKETHLSLPVFSQPLTQPSRQTIVWKVLQEEPGNANSSGAESGSQIKMENSPWRGNETKDIPKKALLINQGDIQGTMERHDEGCEFKEEQGKHPMGTEDESNECTEGLKAAIEYPFREHTRDKMATFSQCGRRYHYSLEPDMTRTLEDHKAYLMSEESCQQNSYLGEPLSTITGDNKSEFLEKEENNLNRDQNNSPEETLVNSPESGNNFSFMNLPKKIPGIQSEGRLYDCSQCGKCFLQRRNLMIHQRSHFEVIPYKCFQCGKCFSQQRNLTIHQRTHTGGKPYKCFQCGKCFSLGKYLKRHESIHTGVKMKPYKCSHCEKCFNQGKELKIHQRIHTGEKPYKCSQCGKCFNQQGNLMNHWRIHTGEKPYKCPVCGKSFGRSNQLKTHQGIHTGEKPYKCSQCGKCFKVEKYLKRHERLHTDQMKALSVRNDAIRELT